MRRFRDGGVGDDLHFCCKLAFYNLPFVQGRYDCNDELASFVCHCLNSLDSCTVSSAMFRECGSGHRVASFAIGNVYAQRERAMETIDYHRSFLCSPFLYSFTSPSWPHSRN
jgi:hypothetical protein